MKPNLINFDEEDVFGSAKNYKVVGSDKYLFKRPELLTHPNIPKPLHGIAPRIILGEVWWNEVRQKAYKENNYCCWACGIHRSDAEYHHWLEAHESYRIDYSIGSVEMIEIVALCHKCHNFIHSGRLWILYQKREIDKEKIVDIIHHGMKILDDVHLKPFFGTKMIQLMVEDGLDTMLALNDCKRLGLIEDTPNIPWNKWHMIIDGKKYYSKFKDQKEWAAYYANK